MGYDYRLTYREGSNNVVADALSRNPAPTYMALSTISTCLLDRIKESWLKDPAYIQYLQKAKKDGSTSGKYIWQNGLLKRKGKLVVGKDVQLQRELLTYFHSSPSGGHSGMDAIVSRIASVLYWKGMKKIARQFVRECEVCQRCKYDHSANPGLLQPLPIPERIWSDVSMDFIEGLPKSAGKDVIFVIVDRLSKYAHFIPLSHPYTAMSVAQAFLDNIYKLHGLPSNIITDRDKIFLSAFWKELFKLLRVDLKFSTAYHPQTDGQTEVLNRSIETYLRCMTCEKPREWSKWLSLAEYWYNTNYHTAAKTTPYQLVYGQPPPLHSPYKSGNSLVDAVDRSLKTREAAIKMLQFHL